MNLKKVFWLEDQLETFTQYRSELFNADYLVDKVRTVSDAVEKLRTDEESYSAIIFDIKVLPGEDKKWIELDKKKRDENPNSDSYLGFELLSSLFNPGQTGVKIEPPVKVNPKKIIVFSVVHDKTKEISSWGIPEYQLLYKATCKPKHLLKVIENIQSEINI